MSKIIEDPYSKSVHESKYIVLCPCACPVNMGCLFLVDVVFMK